jgi:hypothetical protein
MNVLITNSRLDGLGGSQSFVRDLGLALQRLGHQVVAYSSDPGTKERLEAQVIIPTCDQLDDLPFRPDIIHGQHHLDAMTVVIGLPGVPAVYHCHGAVWRESAPTHPRIYHYLAMSRTLGERIMVEANISPKHITAWLNTVDLQRFTQVRQPLNKPQKALFYNKIHRMDSPTVQAIRTAAERLGIEIDFAGHKFGTAIRQPEVELPAYDIIFASGKSAIDAIACGCAVVVMGRTSCGAMVVPENYERLRQVNFSLPVNSPPPNARQVEAELLRYDAAGTASVTKRLRRDADLDACVVSVVDIYESVIRRHKQTPENLAAEVQANLNYLRWIVPLVRGTDLALQIDRADRPVT